jgi:hypothetical protein
MKSRIGDYMNRYVLRSVFFLFLTITLMNCRGPITDRAQEEQKSPVDLTFQIDLDEQIYKGSAYGKPPQMAVWIQNKQDKSIHTVMVTHHMGACDWGGKVERPIALPYWVGFYKRQTGTSGPPTREHPAPDAITFATPKSEFIINTPVPEGSNWNYFVEVNVSGDFNADFPKQTTDGRADRNGNGQPSLVYKGTIEAVRGAISRPAVLGHTDQFEPVTTLTENAEGMTTALELLKTIKVACR